MKLSISAIMLALKMKAENGTAQSVFYRDFSPLTPRLKDNDHILLALSEVIGLNTITYETIRHDIKISVDKLSEPVAFSVEMKVDRVSVEDMLSGRYRSLLDVFRCDLWPESAEDLRITFLASAVELGARLPLDPAYGEGVVIKIGSKSKFSQTLVDLQTEIRPLRGKGMNCPDFKHTTVERFFKPHNFSLDWCAFHLVEKRPRKVPEARGTIQVSAGPQVWLAVKKRDLPKRKYRSMKYVITTSVLGFIVMVAMVSFALCMHDGKVRGTYPSQLGQYEAVQKARKNLRSMSALRDTSTSESSSPRVSMERTGRRPNPPPYSGVHRLARDEFFDDEEAKTWYC